jgi:hypothetical protein
MLNRGNKENDKTLNTACTTFSRTEESKKMTKPQIQLAQPSQEQRNQRK